MIFRIAVATNNGKVTVIDIHKQMILFSHNIARTYLIIVSFIKPILESNHFLITCVESDYHNTVVIPAANLKSEVAAELKEADPNSKEELKKPATISTLNFFNTYSPSKVMTATTQLFVGLNNGHVYQFNLALLVERGPSIAATDIINDYLSLRVTPETTLLDMHVIDLKGKSQNATVELFTPLSKESSQHSSESVEDEMSPKPSSITSSNSVVSNNTSKRMVAIGKAEYRHQDNPHFLVYISLTGVSTVLSGFNVKLFVKEFKDFTVVRSEIVNSHSKLSKLIYLSFT